MQNINLVLSCRYKHDARRVIDYRISEGDTLRRRLWRIIDESDPAISFG
jgi:hypothetical protein